MIGIVIMELNFMAIPTSLFFLSCEEIFCAYLFRFFFLVVRYRNSQQPIFNLPLL